MTVDITTVPGKIDDITFGNGNDEKASLGDDGQPRSTVVINGSFLTNATPEITSIDPSPGSSDIKIGELPRSEENRGGNR